MQLECFLSRDVWHYLSTFMSPLALGKLAATCRAMRANFGNAAERYRFLTLEPRLQLAAKEGHRDIVELMIAKGATHFNGALYWAARGGYFDIVELMMAKGATDFHTPLKVTLLGYWTL